MSAIQTHPSILDKLIEKAKKTPRRILLPEGEDPRIAQAAARMKREGLCIPICLGDPEAVHAAAGDNTIEVIDPKDEELVLRHADLYAKSREIEARVAKRLLKRTLYLAASMLGEGEADAMVAGVANPTEQVLSAAGLAVGFEEGVTNPSSFFLMEMPDGRIFIFADCAVMVDPNAQQLAQIAVATARNCQRLLALEPRVAMLSFSTKGSARHAVVDKVAEAAALAQQAAPELAIDGELQADAAIVEGVATKKCPDSNVGGQANVLIFPDLNAGNIGYKLVQRLAGAKAIGPVMQGFKKPVNDLSRGASADDVIGVSAIAALQCPQN